MIVYAVMCETWNSRCDVEVFQLYDRLEAAEATVKASMSGNRSSYSPTYWVDAMEVHTGD
jgi:pyruvate/2-oxoacid:ferredoxin oxidoreductase alpha subunit